MGLFLNWLEKKKLNEGTPANWQPEQQIGHDPLHSALMKIKKGEGQMPFNGNFSNTNVLAVRFSLNNEELNALKKLNLIVKDEYGVNIDQAKFSHLFNKLAQKTPAMSMIGQNPSAPRLPAPPPPPQKMVPNPTPLS